MSLNIQYNKKFIIMMFVIMFILMLSVDALPRWNNNGNNGRGNGNGNGNNGNGNGNNGNGNGNGNGNNGNGNNGNGNGNNGNGNGSCNGNGEQPAPAPTPSTPVPAPAPIPTPAPIDEVPAWIQELRAYPYNVYNPESKLILQPLRQQLDLSRLNGRYYQIARKQNAFERSCVRNGMEHYQMTLHHGIFLSQPSCTDINNVTHYQSLIVSTLNTHATAFKASFTTDVWTQSFLDNWILEFTSQDDDIHHNKQYQFILTGSPTKEYFHILSRTPNPSNEDIQHFVDRAHYVFGYDISDLIYVPHD